MRGSVQKKGKRYYIVYTIGTKQKWEKVPEPNTKKNADRLLAQRVAEIHRGEYREIKKVTFREFAERWIRDYVNDPNHVKASTAKKYRSVFNAHLMPFFGETLAQGPSAVLIILHDTMNPGFHIAVSVEAERVR